MIDLDTPSPSSHPAGPGMRPTPPRARWSLLGSRQPPSGDRRRPKRPGSSPGPARILSCLIGLSLLWSYWPTLGEMVRRWSQDPRYSHGYLVAPFALYLLWIRRPLRPEHAGPRWPGLML